MSSTGPPPPPPVGVGVAAGDASLSVPLPDVDTATGGSTTSVGLLQAVPASATSVSAAAKRGTDRCGVMEAPGWWG
jgi:hypothetical protein